MSSVSGAAPIASRRCPARTLRRDRRRVVLDPASAYCRCMTPEKNALLATARAAALAAASAIMEIYAEPCAVEQKADASPVTEADRRAEAIIVGRLRRAAPDIAVVAEELAAAGHLPAAAPARFWLVDPLDG